MKFVAVNVLTFTLLFLFMFTDGVFTELVLVSCLQRLLVDPQRSSGPLLRSDVKCFPSRQHWEDDVRRFHRMFRHSPDTELVVLVGNHDIGFHYE